MKADVVISGGGMVGLSLGLALAQGGFRTVVADVTPMTAQLDPKFDGRVSALAYATIRMYRALGVWDAMEKDAQPIREILVTDGAPGRALLGCAWTVVVGPKAEHGQAFAA